MKSISQLVREGSASRKGFYGEGGPVAFAKQFEGTPLYDDALELVEDYIKFQAEDRRIQKENQERYLAQDNQRREMEEKRSNLESELAKLKLEEFKRSREAVEGTD